jgi:hypothetical protein
MFDDTAEDFWADAPDEMAYAHCPYCGESCEILVDPGGGEHQQYIEDCPVCCRPWQVRVDWFDGEAVIQLEAEDD